MPSTAKTPQEYLDELPPDRKETINKMREVILKNLPAGFEEVMSYGMLGYVIPHSLYPKGYHCNPKLPLPLINLGSQKNFIALHHIGMYTDKELNDWFANEYPKHAATKLDMGKGCIRFKKMDDIPYQLIGELSAKMTSQDWIAIYEKAYINKK